MEYSHSIRDVMDAASQRTGIDGWQGYRWQSVEGGSIVHGCVPSGVYSRGPRKGEPKFRPAMPGTERTVIVTDADLDKIAAAYENDNGKCWHCKGTGKTIARLHVTEGATYRDCSRCRGAGLPHNYS